jgi:ATP-dependent RNA helicase MSS116
MRDLQFWGGAGFLSDVTFASLPVDAALHRALAEEFQYANLSDAQARFLPQLLAAPGQDAFVKASTGSGKTLGFLLPALQTAIFAPQAAPKQSSRSSRATAAAVASTPLPIPMAAAAAAAGGGGGDPLSRKSGAPLVGGVRVLILSPSRELAAQTAAEARRLLRFAPRVRTAIVIGGTDRNKDVRMLTSPETVPHVLVATPGRLADLMFDAGPAAAAALSRDVKVVVLDEADRLLDMGFAPAIRRILGALPPSKAVPGAPGAGGGRRTLMFTATVAPEVLKIAKDFMLPDYPFLDAAPGGVDGVPAGVDQAHIKQSAVLADPAHLHWALRDAIVTRRTQGTPAAPFKILVFFPSNALVAFFAELFKTAFGIPVLLLTGDLPQRQRDAATERFRNNANEVLFASDVAGRGMDFPGVTSVVQFGVTRPDVYKQRVGRTGRGGADGEAVIVLGTDERRVVEILKKNQTAPIDELLFPAAAVTKPKTVKASVGSVKPPHGGIPPITPLTGPLEKSASQAYRGLMGAYNSELKTLGWTKQQLVDNIAGRFRSMGLTHLPEIKEQTLKKMGLAGVILPTS